VAKRAEKATAEEIVAVISTHQGRSTEDYTEASAEEDVLVPASANPRKKAKGRSKPATSENRSRVATLRKRQTDVVDTVSDQERDTEVVTTVSPRKKVRGQSKLVPCKDRDGTPCKGTINQHIRDTETSVTPTKNVEGQSERATFRNRIASLRRGRTATMETSAVGRQEAVEAQTSDSPGKKVRGQAELTTTSRTVLRKGLSDTDASLDTTEVTEEGKEDVRLPTIATPRSGEDVEASGPQDKDR